ncbi:calmodulin-binding transcription activator 4 [Cornus florida]|uniref:calmodulin-binding transcription activator 4 n=1 Tax=Cornus florida TaxID=4283 RepID=UPI00289E9139|nr:calmodulin-binding transcription activator 4 [Cornus florida]
MQSGYNIKDLVQEAQSRWLKPAEVLFVLQNYEECQLTHEPPQRPAGGSLFLFNKRVLRFFRRDGHSWRKKKDGRTVGEAHERLKVGNAEALNCYYAHGEQNSNFQRRSYWMLDPAYEHIVLVHYREISEGRQNSGFSRLSPGSPASFSQSPSSYTAQHPGSKAVISELCEPYQTLSSPGSVEVSSDIVIKSNGMDQLDGIETKGDNSSSSELEVSQALRRLEEQLSLNDESLEEIAPLYSENETSNDLKYFMHDQSYSASAGIEDDANNFVLQRDAGDDGVHYHDPLGHNFAIESKEPLYWEDMLDLCKNSPDIESELQEKPFYTLDRNGMLVPPSRAEPVEELEHSQWVNFGGTGAQKSLLPPQGVESLNFPGHTPVFTHESNSNYYATLFGHGQIGMSLEADSSLTIAQTQKFAIREMSPDWGYASEVTKVFIIGSFLCDPSECSWTCMFGDIEVPLQIIQEGVICCQAPVHVPGKVTLCITSGNRESCSEVREFEFRVKPTSCAHCSLPQTEATKSPEELLLLVRFVQILLSDPMMQKGDSSESGIDLLGKSRAGEDLWGHVIEALLVGSWTWSDTTDWLLQELLKDKLQQWLSSRSEGQEQPDCPLSKKEQGIIHMIAGWGFEWALNPILNSGVSINFRDINGWTALHWAARFGREKMVAALIASGASAGAVTDPNSQDPIGKTAASIAAASGHKGLAGYLSEVALTSHLTSLTIEECELSKDSADLEAEITVDSISNRSLHASEDQISLKQTLAAVRNAAQAAARIQSAFRAHSFRRRQHREVVDTASGVDEYSILSNEIHELSAVSKLAFRNARDYNTAALSIQKKYRGWKGRKDFLAFRQKVVKIQAHVRGHQVRKNYKVICWAVGVLEKVVLRWRRRGVGLRGFRPESESINESEDEDIVKVFRKEKVKVAIDEAVSRVLSMVEIPEARQQYRRMLERYRQAKAEREGAGSEVGSSVQGDVCNMENDDIWQPQ